MIFVDGQAMGLMREQGPADRTATQHVACECEMPSMLILQTKRLPADAGRFIDVVLQILKYDVVCDGTAGG